MQKTLSRVRDLCSMSKTKKETFMDINYELYKVFYYVAKTLSFSEAASELYISQSAVSQSIKVLEKRLGEVLFTRSTKRVTLTKEGEMMKNQLAFNLLGGAVSGLFAPESPFSGKINEMLVKGLEDAMNNGNK